jgi:aryl-alcohol dehydrogenase-like predicted oxidoreductase
MHNLKNNSKICIGTANFGLNYGLNNKKPLSKKIIKEIFNFAKSKNINFIDTAMSYKKSENKIGHLKNQNLNIITKITNIPNNVHNIKQWIIDNTILSCKKLNTNKLYGLLIHNTEDLKNKKKSREIFKAFNFLIEKKIVKKIGLSIYDPRELDLYIKDYNFQIVQMPLNIFDRRIVKTGWLKKLKKKKIEIHARSIFLKGLLLKDSNKVDIKFNKWKKKIIFFEKWIIKNNLSKLEANIRFLKNFKEVDKIVVGINDAFELREIYSFFKKKSLKIPEYLNIKAGIILNPKEWKI